MAHEVRFTVGILPDHDWPVVLERFRHVEALGFDVAGTGDQFADSWDPSKPWFGGLGTANQSPGAAG